jgi:hypothetical protein
MMFLGMCISVNSLYNISSNLERGVGRPDIVMESKDKVGPHIIIEFKRANKTKQRFA